MWYGCLLEWQDDEWCDGNCQALVDPTGECNDAYDCSGEHICDEYSSCYDAWLYLINTAANVAEPRELIDNNELCQFWGFVSLYSSEFNNCTHAYSNIDLNDDGYISFYESLQFTAAFFGITDQKAKQLNCSSCLIIQIYIIDRQIISLIAYCISNIHS